jgi:hypothetical protein
VARSDDLIDRSFCFKNRRAVIHNAGQIGVGKGNAVVRVIAQEIAGCRLPVSAEEKTGLRAQVGVSPSV